MRGLATPTTPSTLADWVEINLLVGPLTSLSEAQLVDILREDRPLGDLDLYDLEGSFDDADETLLEDDFELNDVLEQGAPDAAEVLAEDAFGVIEQRALILGDAYPLEVDATRIHVVRDRPIYRFLCALEARHLAGTRSGLHRGARLFELLSALAMANYLGGSARAIGFPRRDASGFRDAVQILVREMREKLSVPVSNIPGSIKDLGVDVAAWRPIDQAPGNAVILCQCATGGNWDTKGVEMEVWSKVVQHAVTPIRALTFPFVPDLDPTSFDWELICGHVGIPIHRLRFAGLLQSVDIPADLRREIEDWTGKIGEVVFGADPFPADDSDDDEEDANLSTALQDPLRTIMIDL